MIIRKINERRYEITNKTNFFGKYIKCNGGFKLILDRAVTVNELEEIVILLRSIT